MVDPVPNPPDWTTMKQIFERMVLVEQYYKPLTYQAVAQHEATFADEHTVLQGRARAGK